jgi:hypothetical protein
MSVIILCTTFFSSCGSLLDHLICVSKIELKDSYISFKVIMCYNALIYFIDSYFTNKFTYSFKLLSCSGMDKNLSLGMLMCAFFIVFSLCIWVISARILAF